MKTLEDAVRDALIEATDRRPLTNSYGHEVHPRSDHLYDWTRTVIQSLRDSAKATPGILEPLLHD